MTGEALTNAVTAGSNTAAAIRIQSVKRDLLSFSRPESATAPPERAPVRGSTALCTLPKQGAKIKSKLFKINGL